MVFGSSLAGRKVEPGPTCCDITPPPVRRWRAAAGCGWCCVAAWQQRRPHRQRHQNRVEIFPHR
eukprot:1352598-Prymnesium_polylepis.1